MTAALKKMEKQVFEYNHRNRKILVEIGELAKQANGACLVRYEDTAVLSAAVGSNQAMATDFFPLTVLYQEKLYLHRQLFHKSVLHTFR